MNDKNVVEYQELSETIREVNESIVRLFVGIITVSGTLMIAIFRFSDFDRLEQQLQTALLVLAVATLTLFATSVLNYRSSVHNRLVGYRTIITTERFTRPDANVNIEDSEPAKDSKSTIKESDVPKKASDGLPPGNEEPANLAFDFCNEHLNQVLATKTFDISPVSARFIERRGVFHGMDTDQQSEENEEKSPDLIVKTVAWHYSSKTTFFEKVSPTGWKKVDLTADGLGTDAPFPNGSKHIDSEFYSLLFFVWVLLPLYVPFIRKCIRRFNKRFLPEIGTWGLPGYMNAILVGMSVLAWSIAWLLAFSDFYNAIKRSFCIWGNGNLETDKIKECELLLNATGQGPSLLLVTFFFLLSIVFLPILRSVILQWVQLMYGCRTVRAYFFQFLPFRMIYLLDVQNIRSKNGFFVRDERPHYAGPAVRDAWSLRNHEPEM